MSTFYSSILASINTKKNVYNLYLIPFDHCNKTKYTVNCHATGHEYRNTV